MQIGRGEGSTERVRGDIDHKSVQHSLGNREYDRPSVLLLCDEGRREETRKL